MFGAYKLKGAAGASSPSAANGTPVLYTVKPTKNLAAVTPVSFSPALSVSASGNADEWRFLSLVNPGKAAASAAADTMQRSLVRSLLACLPCSLHAPPLRRQIQGSVEIVTQTAIEAGAAIAVGGPALPTARARTLARRIWSILRAQFRRALFRFRRGFRSFPRRARADARGRQEADDRVPPQGIAGETLSAELMVAIRSMT